MFCCHCFVFRYSLIYEFNLSKLLLLLLLSSRNHQYYKYILFLKAEFFLVCVCDKRKEESKHIFEFNKQQPEKNFIIIFSSLKKKLRNFVVREELEEKERKRSNQINICHIILNVFLLHLLLKFSISFFFSILFYFQIFHTKNNNNN